MRMVCIAICVRAHVTVENLLPFPTIQEDYQFGLGEQGQHHELGEIHLQFSIVRKLNF